MINYPAKENDFRSGAQSALMQPPGGGSMIMPIPSRDFYCRLSIVIFCYFIFPVLSGCQPVSYQSPAGYDLKNPTRFVLGDALHEISGIVFLKQNRDTIYAIEDENGKLFFFHPGSRTVDHVKFGKKGDYEDVALLNNREFVVLRSDGTLFKFPVSQVRSGKMDSVQIYEQILPKGEYEGLFGDDNGLLYAMCKHCPQDKHKEVTIYILQEDGSGTLKVQNQNKVKVSGEPLSSINQKVRFHPSCLARHPLTRDWYIVSSVNKALIILDDHWNVKYFYSLDPVIFKQPEGLAFDGQGNMYISNEGGQGLANVLLFPYKKPG
jgi:uncharacterized protein YjiK